MRLPRIKGSSTHNPLAEACLVRVEGKTVDGEVCRVCAATEVMLTKEQSRYFLDHVRRELGS